MGANKIDLTKDTIYKHPTVIQCDASTLINEMNLQVSTVSTKVTELENTVQNINTSPVVCGTGTVTYDGDYDAHSATYVECTFAGNHSNLVFPIQKVTVSRNNTVNVALVYNDNTHGTISVSLNSSGTTLTVGKTTYMYTMQYICYTQ